MMNGKWTALIQHCSNQWPLRVLSNITLHSPIQTPIHIFIHTFKHQRCVNLADSSSGAFRVRCLTQGHLDTQLRGAGYRTSNLPGPGPHDTQNANNDDFCCFLFISNVNPFSSFLFISNVHSFCRFFFVSNVHPFCSFLCVSNRRDGRGGRSHTGRKVQTVKYYCSTAVTETKSPGIFLTDLIQTALFMLLGWFDDY